jgi:hypothetical protein
MMATNRKRLPRGRLSSSGITETDYLYFAFGPFFDAEDYEVGKSEEELKAFWMKHRKAILERYSERNRLKGKGWEGCRPRYFWAELTEPRLPVDMTLVDNELWNLKKVGFDGLEADYAYLKRLGLLEPWELEAENADK